MNRDKTQICILGGGFGGLYTALYLSKFSWSHKCNIVLIEQKDRFLFTPLLYELLTQELKPQEIAPSYQKLLRHTKIQFCQNKIVKVDLKNQNIELATGDRLLYDYAIVAVGNKNRVPQIPGSDLVYNFRTLADVELIEAKIELLLQSCQPRKLQIAIVGTGANGIELACKLADRLPKNAKIRAVDRSSAILKDFSPQVRSAADRALKKRNIKVDLETEVAKITSQSITLIYQSNQTVTLPADLVFWTGGIESHQWISNLSHCKQNATGKILTLPTLQLIDYPEVFALGDVAKIYNSERSLPATAQVAYQQANLIAINIQASLKGKSLKSFQYLHLGDMLTLGNGAAVISSFSFVLEGYLAAIVRQLVYIQRLPTNRHRFQVVKNILIRGIKGIFNCKPKLKYSNIKHNKIK